MKKGMLVLAVAMIAVLLGSCTIIPGSKLEAMFRNDQHTSVISSGTHSAGDTVTISREE